MKYGKITEGTLQTLEVEKGVQVGGKLIWGIEGHRHGI